MPKKISSNKVFFYYNPVAGNKVLSTKIDLIIQTFQEAGQHIIPYRSSKKDNLKSIFKKEIDFSEYSKILVGGGDGTINKVANALLENNIDVPLAVLPFGTANDYARFLKIPRDIEKMLKIATKKTSKQIDVGLANDKYFLNVFAVGALATLPHNINVNAKNILGPLSYYIQGVSSLPVTLKPVTFKISSPEKSFNDKAMFAIIMNGVSAGGFKKISPFSKIDDGVFDIFIFKTMPFYDLLPTFIQILSGTHVKNKNVVSWKSNEFNIEAPFAKVPVITDTDGEPAGPLPKKVTLLHKKLKVIF